MNDCLQQKVTYRLQSSSTIWFRVRGRQGRCRLDGPYHIVGTQDTIRGPVLLVRQATAESTDAQKSLPPEPMWVPFSELSIAVFPGAA